MKKTGFKKSTFIIALLALVGMLLSSAFASESEKVEPKQEMLKKEVDSLIDYKKKWKKASGKDPAYTIYFPGKASLGESIIPIPGDTEASLTIKQHTFSKDAISYSLSYTELPADWLKYGSGLVLKGALKLMAKHSDDADIAGKTSNTFKALPSLDYSHIAGDTQTTGTLVLCGSHVYAVEVKHAPSCDEAEYTAHLKSFLDSFSPEKIG